MESGRHIGTRGGVAGEELALPKSREPDKEHEIRVQAISRDRPSACLFLRQRYFARWRTCCQSLSNYAHASTGSPSLMDEAERVVDPSDVGAPHARGRPGRAGWTARPISRQDACRQPACNVSTAQGEPRMSLTLERGADTSARLPAKPVRAFVSSIATSIPTCARPAISTHSCRRAGASIWRNTVKGPVASTLHAAPTRVSCRTRAGAMRGRRVAGCPAPTSTSSVPEHLDANDVEFGVLKPLLEGNSPRNVELQAALCSAFNDSQATHFTDVEPRLRSSHPGAPGRRRGGCRRDREPLARLNGMAMKKPSDQRRCKKRGKQKAKNSRGRKSMLAPPSTPPDTRPTITNKSKKEQASRRED